MGDTVTSISWAAPTAGNIINIDIIIYLILSFMATGNYMFLFFLLNLFCKSASENV